MRTAFLLPLAALMAIVAGCRSDVRERTTGSLPRDLTLVTQSPGVAVASAVEMQQLRVEHRTRRPSQPAVRPAATRPSRDPKVRLAAVAAPLASVGTGSPVLAAPEPTAEPTSTAPTPDNGRELLPGKTVTLIPASSGPSTGSDTADEFPPTRGRTMVARGGGTCRGRGRGPGIGIAAAPRPDFR